MIRKTIRHARKMFEARRPLFPSYVFVQCRNDQRWRPILSTIGVRDVVMLGRQPAVLDPDLISALRASEIDGVICRRAQDFQVGEQVGITVGPMHGLIGEVVEAQPNDRIAIMLRFFGMETLVRLPASCAQPVSG